MHELADAEAGSYKLINPQRQETTVQIDDIPISWSKYNYPGVKYFSETAEYHKSFTLKEEDLNQGKLCLDLGNVQELAEIIINDQYIGIGWMLPFIVGITDFVAFR